MNQTINNKITALTNLIAEIRDKDDETDCLIVELDYLIKHLQQYKKTCESNLILKGEARNGIGTFKSLMNKMGVETCEELPETCFLCRKQFTVKTDRPGMCSECEKFSRCDKVDCKCAGCEDAKHDKEFPDHERCDECYCCIDCGCCECDDDWMCGLCGKEWSQEEEFCPDCSEYGQKYE